jgi:hypothetical protein
MYIVNALILNFDNFKSNEEDPKFLQIGLEQFPSTQSVKLFCISLHVRSTRFFN